MTNYDQSTETKFRLNQQKGITNIGSHPDNDITISDPRVLPFHLIIDNRQTPYKIIALQPNSNITVQGVRVSSGEPIEVKDLNQVQFNGFQLHIPAGAPSNGTVELEILPPKPGTSAPVDVQQPVDDVDETLPETTGEVDSAASFIPAMGKYPMQFPPAHKDEIILVHLPSEMQTINVEQPAVYSATVINGGPIVATFDLQLEGVPEEWVSLQPKKLNLNEGGRGQVEIRITPPRDSSSLAATYPIQLSASSPNYPGHMGQANTSITVNPFYQYSVGNLEPRNQSASWSKRSGNAYFPISNLGNSLAAYQVTATDDENKLRFEFPQEDQSSLTRQSEVKVEPGAVKTVPLTIDPLKRNFFRLRKKQYNYSIRTQPLDDEGATQMLSGQFASRPLFGFLSLVLFAAIMLVSGYFLMRPRIIEFKAVKDIVELGQPVALNWKVSFFTSDISIEGVNEKLEGSQNQISVTPTNTVTTYTLVASNWLSRLLRMPNLRSEPVTVLMIPASPSITTFSVNKNAAFVGDTVNIKWSIANGDKAFLTVDRVTDTLDKEKFNGERPVVIAKDTLVVLEVQNSSGNLVRSEFIKAREPAIRIEEFTLSKTTITQGEPVTIKWKVSGDGVETVNISPFTDPLPLTGEMTFYPKESMEFIMSVKNRDLEEIRLLPVGVLPPGSPPEPPTINFFKAAPEEMVGSGESEFSWSISGLTDKIEITDAGGTIKTDLPAQGFTSVSVGKTTNYILTAYNKTASAAASLEVKINPALMNTLVEINSVVPSTGIFRGDPIQVYFSVDPFINGQVIKDVIDANLPEVSGKVVVTDGFDTCEATLPQTSCVLTLNTSSPTKQITATYSGDSNYARRTSDPYPSVGYFNVMGTPAKFVSHVITPDPTVPTSELFVGQQISIKMVLGPEDPAKSGAVTGDVGVWEVDSVGNEIEKCKVSLQGVVGEPNQGSGTCSITFNSAGNKVLRFKYFGNNMYDGAILNIPDVPAIFIKPANTTTAILTDLATATLVGQPVSVSVKVTTNAPASGVPLGKVRIFNTTNSSDSCEAILTNGSGSCQLTLTKAAVNGSLTARYTPFTADFSSSQSVKNHSVEPADTVAKITSLPVKTIGDLLTVQFSVIPKAPGAGTPTGKVTVFLGTSMFCELQNIGAQSGSCSAPIQTGGTQSFYASYAGDTNFNPSTSPTVAYTPNRATTTTSINSASADTANPKLFTIAVDVISTSSVPVAGDVLVRSTTENVSCTIAGYSQSNKTCDLTFSTEGEKIILATFAQTNEFATSTTADFKLVVKKASSVTSFVSDQSTAPVNSAVKFSVQVVPAAPDANIPSPTGSVTVKASTGETCTVYPIDTLLGTGNCYITFTSTGPRTVTGSYLGDTYYNVSQSLAIPIDVTLSPTTIETSFSVPSSAVVGDKLPVSVVVKPVPTTNPSDPEGTVKISNNLGEDCTITLQTSPSSTTEFSTGSCSLTFTSPQTVTSITAAYTASSTQVKYTDSNVTTTTSIVVAKAPSITSIVKIASKSDTTQTSITKAATGQPITVHFKVAPSNSNNTSPLPGPANVTVTATHTVGTVTTTKTCVKLLSNTGTGSCDLALEPSGDWTITAKYAGDSNFLASPDSVAKSFTIEAADTTIALSVPTGKVVGETVTIGVTVTADSPSTGVPSGKVTLNATKGTGANLQTVNGTCPTVTNGNNLTNGTADCTLVLEEAGTWSLTADFTSSVVGYNTSSKSADLIIGAAGTTTTLSVTTSPVVNSDLTLKAVVKSSIGATSPLPTGTIAFKEIAPGETTASNITNCSAVALTAGTDTDAGSSVAECTFQPDTYGSWKFSAAFTSGDSNYTASTATQITQAVSGLTYTLAITSDATTTYVDSTKTYTVTFETASTNSVKPTETIKITTKAPGATATVDQCTSPTLALTLDTGSKYIYKTTCNIKLDQEGVWTITATYPTGDSLYPTQTATITVTSSKYSTTLSGTTSLTPYDFVDSSNNVIADSFLYKDTTKLRSNFSFTLAIDPATVVTTSLPDGYIKIIAKYHHYNSLIGFEETSVSETVETKAADCPVSDFNATSCSIVLNQHLESPGRWNIDASFVPDQTDEFKTSSMSSISLYNAYVNEASFSLPSGPFEVSIFTSTSATTIPTGDAVYLPVDANGTKMNVSATLQSYPAPPQPPLNLVKYTFYTENFSVDTPANQSGYFFYPGNSQYVPFVSPIPKSSTNPLP